MRENYSFVSTLVSMTILFSAVFNFEEKFVIHILGKALIILPHVLMRKHWRYNNSKVKTYYNHQHNYELVYWALEDKIWKCDCGKTKEDKLIFKPKLKDLPEQEIIIWKRHGLN